MTLYLDTSVLVPLFVDDLHSPKAIQVVSTGESVTTSRWAAAEFSSALSLQVRVGRLTLAEREAAERDLDHWLAEQVHALPIAHEDFEEARRLLRTAPGALRTPDALHLAVCRRLHLTLATFDDQLRSTAAAVGAAVN